MSSSCLKLSLRLGMAAVALAALAPPAQAQRIPVMISIGVPRSAVPLRSFARFTATLRETTAAPYHGAGLVSKGIDLSINGTVVDTQITSLVGGLGYVAFNYFVPADLGVGTGHTARVTFNGDDTYAPGVAWDWWATAKTPTKVVLLATPNPAPLAGTYRATITLYQLVAGSYLPLPDKPVHICYCVTHCTDKWTDAAGRIVDPAAINGFCTIMAGFMGDDTYGASCCCPCYYK